MRRLMCVLLVGFWLAACAPVSPVTESTTAPDTAGPSGEGVATTAPSTADLPATAESDVQGEGEAAIVFTRGGGLAGTHEAWTIYTDGAVTRADAPDAAAQAVGQVMAEQVTALVTGLDALGFFRLQDAYGANDNCADCFLYSVTVTSGGVTKTVTTHDAASDAPPELGQALELIQTLLNSVG